MPKKREFIPNMVFVGLPWKNVRPKYERIIKELRKRYPLYFTIVGRNDGQSALNLFDIIKNRIDSSSWAIFDATGGNPNVSLEYGYAEGKDVPRCIFLSAHKASLPTTGSSPIISDLHGMRRVQYKNENSLLREMDKFAREHEYTIRFESALKSAFQRRTRSEKKSCRALALKIVQALDGHASIRRVDLVQQMLAQNYDGRFVEDIMKKLHDQSIIKCTVGRFADVYIS